MVSPAPLRTSAAPDEERLANRRRLTFLAVWASVAVVVLVAFRSILVPFILGALLAYIFSPLCDRLTRVRVAGRPVQRWVAVLGIYITLLLVLASVLLYTVPWAATETREFVRTEVPRVRQQAMEAWNQRWRGHYERYVEPLLRAEGEAEQAAGVPQTARGTDDQSVHLERLENSDGWRVLLPRDGILVQREHNENFRIVSVAPSADGLPMRREAHGVVHQLRRASAGHSGDLLRAGGGMVGATVGGIFRFFICLMLSAYMLLTAEDILGFFRGLVRSEQRSDFDLFVRRLDRGLSGVVRGQLIICAVNGFFSAVGFAFARLPYWPLLALVCAIFSIIPIFGSFLSTIPAVLVALRLGIGSAVFVVVWVIAIHQVEANLLNPKIMGDAAKIHPVLVVFSLLVGEHFFGLLGALLAVPAMSITQTVFLHWKRYALDGGRDAPSDSLPPAEPPASGTAPAEGSPAETV